jgi:predicted DNA-binding protein (UPF0251 family)
MAVREALKLAEHRVAVALVEGAGLEIEGVEPGAPTPPGLGLLGEGEEP